jgi:hypothetical protein
MAVNKENQHEQAMTTSPGPGGQQGKKLEVVLRLLRG